MPLVLFRNRTFSATNLLTLFLYGALAAASLFLSLDLVQIQGYSKTQAGLALLPFAILLIVLSPWAGRLSGRLGPRLFLTVGPALVALGLLWLSFQGLAQGPGAYLSTWLPGIVLFGLGMGFTVAPLSTAVMGSLEPEKAGTASGVNNAVSRIAGVLVLAVLGAWALLVFSDRWASLLAPLALDSSQRSLLAAEASKFGGAILPTLGNSELDRAVTETFRNSFNESYRLVLWVCAALAGLGALAGAGIKGKNSGPAPSPTGRRAAERNPP